MAVADLLRWVPAALRLTEEEERWWRGLLGPHARVEDYLALRRAAVATLIDPARVPDDQVRSLAALVGLDDALLPVRGAELETLRRLIPVAVALWRRKGSVAAIRAVARQLVGRSVLVRAWRDVYAPDGHEGEVALLPDPGTSVGSEYDYPESVLDVWVPDPDADLDDLAGWLGLVRATQRRYNLRRAVLVEDGLEDQAGVEARWSAVAGDVVADPVGQVVTVSAGGALLRTGGWLSLGVLWLATWTGASQLIVLGDEDDGYRLDVDWTTGAAELSRVVGGVATSLATTTWPVASGTAYRLRLEATGGAVATTVRARWEGLILEAIDTDPARLTQGGFGLVAASGSVVLAGVLAHQLPADTVRVGPTP